MDGCSREGGDIIFKHYSSERKKIYSARGQPPCNAVRCYFNHLGSLLYSVVVEYICDF